MLMNQRTVNEAVSIKGRALHSGKEVEVTLKPLAAESGIIFKRTDLKGDNVIEAKYSNVTSTTLCTEIGNEAGAKVATIEHLMAAFFFLGIDNILVEVRGSELPAVDGSAYGFMQKILKVGLKELDSPKSILEILETVSIKSDKWELSIKPSESFIINGSISFEHSFINNQSYSYRYGEYVDAADISKAKTFGFLKDIDFLHKNGIGLGANSTNSNIITENGILDGCKLSYKDEFVKHKILDMCGDLYLSGYVIKGEITAFKPGHLANNQLLKAIFNSKANYNVKHNIKTVVFKYPKREDAGVFTY